ncbi:hypothetical protein T06_424 [Trichinella sp. T6]|nr:hypothetical protein T06_424 [Trichinella sp. T6]
MGATEISIKVDLQFSVLSIRGLLADERNKIRYHHPKFAC